MSKLTVSYSTHRPETIDLTARVMEQHDVIILEEPPHGDFIRVLDGEIDIEEHLLELDIDYPVFTLNQYRLLQDFHRSNREILQIEPYLENLLQIQLFLADNHRPDEIKPKTIAHRVYCAERLATRKLLGYYKEVRGNDFTNILHSMNTFARADANRFILRDSLRANSILEVLKTGKNIYIEAGTIHILLYSNLAKKLRKEDWSMHFYSADKEAVNTLGYHGNLIGPGDLLTLNYIFGRDLSKQKWARLCAQALIYSKIVKTEETLDNEVVFPHTRNEMESIAAVKYLTTDCCRILFQRIRKLSSEDAADVVKCYHRDNLS